MMAWLKMVRRRRRPMSGDGSGEGVAGEIKELEGREGGGDVAGDGEGVELGEVAIENRGNLNGIHTIRSQSIGTILLLLSQSIEETRHTSKETKKGKRWTAAESAASPVSEHNDTNSRVGVLKIKDSKELAKYMEIELWSSSFKRLRVLIARECDQELTKFLSYLRFLSHGLQQLTIEKCELLEQVFDLQNLPHNKYRPRIFFPNLQAMRLCGLPKLICISNNDPIFMGTVEYGNLVELEIIECGSLKGPVRTLCFKMLKRLTVDGCNQLRYILPLHVFQNLRALEKLVIRDCEMLERVFGDDDEKDTQMRESNYAVHQLPQVRILILIKLPKFNGCCRDGCTIEWLSLETIRVVECPKIHKSSLGMMKKTLLTNVKVDSHSIAYFFELMDEVSRAEELKIKGSEHLKKYMEMKPQPSSFSSLRILKARQCDQEINKFLPILFRGSHKLEELTIEDCELMEQVFDLGDLAPNIPNLERMRLYGLHKLKCIWNNDPELRGTIEIGNRVELEITKCGVLKGSLPTALLEKLVQLKLESCDMIEQVIEEEKEMMHHRLLHNLEDLQLVNLQKLTKFSSSHCNLTFPSLRRLRIEKCPQLNIITARISSNQTTNEGTPNHAPSDEQMALLVIPALSYGKVPLQNLETLEIVDCNDIQYLFVIKGLDMLETYSGLLPDLLQLHLFNLGKFRSIVGPKHLGRTLSFKMLNELIVCGCNQMRYVLPLHVIQNLQQLENIEIRDCNMLERIFGDEEVTQMRKSNNSVHQLPQVNSLILEKLRKFSGCCQDGRNVEWLSLKSVRVVECPMIQKSSLGKIDRPLLTSMQVGERDKWASNEDKESNIKYLFELTGKLSSLEELEIKDSEELKKYMEMELQPSSFSSLRTVGAKKCNVQLNNFLSDLLHRSNGLKELIVANCELLEQVFDLTEFVEKQGDLKFPILNTMKLLCLPNLKWIWNNDPRGILGLGNLVKLEIIKCGLRRSPISAALLEKLDALKALKIESCDMIEQIVEDDVEMHERMFRNLEDLEIVNLPKLTKFNSGHCNFRFPKLLRLTIEKCPQLNVLTARFLSNQTLTMEGKNDHVPPNEIMDACSKLQTLKLAGHESFKEIWQCWVSNNIRDCDLKVVEVDSFRNLKHIFPSNMLPILLKKLETLVVRNCISLSNVFQPVRKNDSIMAFQNLKIIRVKGCDSLQCLLLPFTYPGLREIDISDCQSLEEIFIDSEIKVVKKSFPNLESIVLENLPVLSSLSLEAFEFPKLKNAIIVKCPAIKTFSRNVSDEANDFVDKNSSGSQQIGHGKTILLPELQELVLSDLPNIQLRDQILEFKNLTSLEIIGCGSIEKLFPISVAEHLSSLKLLTLYKCENMVQVLHMPRSSEVRSGRGTEKQMLVFKKLETLVLKHLPRLTSFCEVNVPFGELPELKMVRVENVPKMKTFVKRPLIISTPKLKQVHVTFITRCWLGDLNNTIKHVHEKHDKLKQFWESDQSSTRQPDTVEKTSQGKSEI